MADENDKAPHETPVEEAEEPRCGERLAEARRALQIPVLEIAKELHLDEYKVRAIESNEFDVLGAPVFAKGHLRKFAQLVDVDEADILYEYQQLNVSTDAPQLVSLGKKPRREISPGPWIAVLVALLIVAALYWWFAIRDPDVGGVPFGGSNATNVVELPTDNETADSEPIDLPADNASSNTEDATAVPVTDLPVVVTTPPPATDVATLVPTRDIQLTLAFSGDCWTEITDVNGRRLFFDLGATGRTVNLSGEGPITALFGNADNVEVTVNGTSFVIPAADRRNLTAKTTIRAQ